MKRFHKVYVEISNVCNLSCRFCPGTKRQPHIMDTAEFATIIQKLRPYTDHLYFHLMGEPLLHPKLEEYLCLAGAQDFKVILTTNGTLLAKQQEMLLSAPSLHKVNISLHAFEANDLSVPFEDYLAACFAYGKAATGNKLTVFRLWNQGGEEEKNAQILSALEKAFPKPWQETRSGVRLADKVYLEYGSKFDWPDISLEEGSDQVYCYGLKDQIGILCDGTVVPCCLDHDGDIPLGNLLTQEFSEILNNERTTAIIEGFKNRNAVEPLCRRCGYAKRF